MKLASSKWAVTRKKDEKITCNVIVWWKMNHNKSDTFFGLYAFDKSTHQFIANEAFQTIKERTKTFPLVWNK